MAEVLRVLIVGQSNKVAVVDGLEVATLSVGACVSELLLVAVLGSEVLILVAAVIDELLDRVRVHH